MSEWEHRQLCADGACVGLIGPDGTCKVCGHAAPNWGSERRRGMVEEPPEATEDVGPIATVRAATDDPTEQAAWTGRGLCPDGACIGLIGADGTCKVCGRAAPNWGSERRRGMVEEPPGAAQDVGPVAVGSAAASADPVAWDDRKLCPDDACVGVIGAGGACGVCGSRAE